MSRFAYFAVLVLLAALAALVGYSGGKPVVVPKEQGSASLAMLWRINLPDVDGKPQALEQWRGQVLVLNFWATWCPPCRREIPDLMRMAERYRTQGVVFVGIGVDQEQAVRDYAQKAAINYPVLLGSMDYLYITRRLGNPTEGLPFTLVLDRQGQIAYTREGLVNEQALQQAIAKLLAKP